MLNHQTVSSDSEPMQSASFALESAEKFYVFTYFETEGASDYERSSQIYFNFAHAAK